jgi:multiple sugar transport system substrate-binding protein
MKHFFSRRTFFFSALVFSTLSLAGCGSEPKSQSYTVPPIEIWGVFDDSDAYAKAISDYRELNPSVKSITYRKLPVETYKEDLINALAAGKGPDIFMIRNSWRKSFEDKTAPAPEGLLNERLYRDTFVDVAATDFIGTENKVYGMPLSVDSLALYYNKDILNAAGISQPPQTWDEVKEDVRLLNMIDQFGTITRSGIALGTGSNINRSSDILTVLMMQFGALLDRKPEDAVNLDDGNGMKAFDFYTQFSRIGSEVYSWNPRQDYSIDAFYKGNLAMMINYSWQYETIKQKNAKLNIGMVPLPQASLSDTPVNTANYWGFVVAKDKPVAQTGNTTAVAPANPEQQNYLRTFEAWQFLKYLTLAGKDKKMVFMNGLSGTTKEVPLSVDPTKEYLDRTHKPAARRDLITVQQDDVTLSAFAYGNLIAKSWYQGDSEAVDGILIDAIDNVVRGEKTVQGALGTAESRINLLRR